MAAASKLPSLEGTDLPALFSSNQGGSTTKAWIVIVKDRILDVGVPKLALSYTPKDEEFAFLKRNIGWYANLRDKAKQDIAEDLFVAKVTSGDLPKAGERFEPGSAQSSSSSEEDDGDELMKISKFVLKTWKASINDSNWYIIMNGVKTFEDLEANMVYYYKVLYAIKRFLPMAMAQVKFSFNTVTPKSFPELFDLVLSMTAEGELDMLVKSLNNVVLTSAGSAVIVENADALCAQVLRSAKLVSNYIDEDPNVVKEVLYRMAYNAVSSKVSETDAPKTQQVLSKSGIEAPGGGDKNRMGVYEFERLSKAMESIDPEGKRAFKKRFSLNERPKGPNSVKGKRWMKNSNGGTNNNNRQPWNGRFFKNNNRCQQNNDKGSASSTQSVPKSASDSSNSAEVASKSAELKSAESNQPDSFKYEANCGKDSYLPYPPRMPARVEVDVCDDGVPVY